MPQKILSVGDVAYELEIHEREVREWAEENEIPAVGTEYMFSPADVTRFQGWLEDQQEEEEEEDDDDDDDESDGTEDDDDTEEEE